MATQEYIKRETHGGNQNEKTPFMIAMVDSDDKLVSLNFPSQNQYSDIASVSADLELLRIFNGQSVISPEKILGIELMINPATLSVNMSKIINRTQSMVGFIEEHWGEEVDTITFQGNSAAFVVGGSDIYTVRLSTGSVVQKYLQDADTNLDARSDLYTAVGLPETLQSTSGVTDDEPGLTTSRRRHSVSYQQMKRYADIVRTNGLVFDTQGFVSKRYRMMLSYGSSCYKGLFESLDITQDAANPFRFQYTATFKSELTVYSYVNYGSTFSANTAQLIAAPESPIG